jgi:hypothetical protein
MLMDQIASRTLSRKGLSAVGEGDESEGDDLFSDGFGAGYSLEDGDLVMRYASATSRYACATAHTTHALRMRYSYAFT